MFLGELTIFIETAIYADRQSSPLWPKDNQSAFVNVPARHDNIAKTLPRIPTDCGLVPVKLMKKLEYRGHTMF